MSLIKACLFLILSYSEPYFVLTNAVSLLRHHTFDLSANALPSVILFTHTHVLESPGSERWDSVGGGRLRCQMVSLTGQ